jgi:hypothetical protein
MAARRPSIGTIVFTYYPLCLTGVTTVLNSLTIIVLYQKVFRQRATIGYMRAMALVDMLMLYGWNLDHFFLLKFGFEVDRLTVLSCKLSTYYNHFLVQSSAWLRVLMCIDRFCALNQVQQRRAIYQHRRVRFLIASTFIAIALINLHLPIFSCYAYYDKTGMKIASGSLYFRLYPTWNYINLALYNLIPFILMLIFNILIIRHLILIKKTSTIQKSHIRHSSISIPILLSAFLFCIMTTPPAITFAFFHQQTRSAIFTKYLLNILDSIKYTYHSLSFFLYFITLVDFRRGVFRLLRCQFIKTDGLSQVMSNTRSNQYRIQSIPITTITK